MFRSLVAEPAELQRLANAFDAAWIAVNSRSPIDALEASAERERLGYILMKLWEADASQDLAADAVSRFLAGQGKVATSTEGQTASD